MVEKDPLDLPVPETTEQVVITETVFKTLPANRPRKVSSGMFGPLEIAAVAIGIMAVIGALTAYFVFVIPSNRELARNRAEADRLEAEMTSAKSKYGDITNSNDQVGKLVSSVDDFEARFLPMPVNGQTALYQRLNSLIAAYDLENTTGPDYVPLETADLNQEKPSDDQKGRAKYRSLYPGVYVSTTLDGSYQNLRRFIREIETSRDFIIVSSVELAPSDADGQKDKTNPAANPALNPAANTSTVRTLTPGPKINPVPGSPASLPPGFSGAAMNQPGMTGPPAAKSAKGKMHGETVSLHIELAAYFRRPSVSPVAVAR